MNKEIAQKINNLTSSYLNDEVADDFDLGSEISQIIHQNAKELDVSEQLALIFQSAPLLFGHPAANDEHLASLAPLRGIMDATKYCVSDYVFQTFVEETKIKLTQENENDIFSFFAEKGNWQSDEYRKQGLAVLIEALLKSYNSL